MTRSVLSAFKKKKFQNPVKAAELFVSVRVLIKKCPELEARLSLQEPPKIRKRRQSTPARTYLMPNNIKRRRLSECPQSDMQMDRTSAEFISQADDDNLDFCTNLNQQVDDQLTNEVDDSVSFEPLVYSSSSSSSPEPTEEHVRQFDEVRLEANENSANKDRKDLADSISNGLKNLRKILARRHSLDSRINGKQYYTTAEH